MTFREKLFIQICGGLASSDDNWSTPEGLGETAAHVTDAATKVFCREFGHTPRDTAICERCGEKKP